MLHDTEKKSRENIVMKINHNFYQIKMRNQNWRMIRFIGPSSVYRSVRFDVIGPHKIYFKNNSLFFLIPTRDAFIQFEFSSNTAE